MNTKEYRELDSCHECGGKLKWSDNSMSEIKNNNGICEIAPIYHCDKCNTYYIAEIDDKGILYIKLNKWDIKRFGCDKWYFR